MPTPPRQLHILLLNQPFYPDVAATAQMARDLADTLVRRGHKVTAVASRSIYGRSGAVLPPRETIPVPDSRGAIEVHRVGANLFGKSGIASRLADFALFYVLAAFKVLSVPRADVVVGFTTPPFIAMLGLVTRFFRGSRAAHWVMDLYPDVPVACGVMRADGLLTRACEAVSRTILRRSDVNVVLGRCMRDRVLAKKVPESKVKWIPVWADLAGVEPVAPEHNEYRAAWAPGGEFVVMYSGNFGIAHDAGTILEAMRRLKDERGVRFVFVGSGKRRAEVEAFVKAHALTNVSWHDYQPREKLGGSLSAGDVHLISVRSGAEGTIVPSKLFGVMAVARPAIFIGSESSEVARVLAECDGGVLVREGDGEALASAILALRDDPARRAAMGARARAHLAGRYDRDTACGQWAELLESIA